MGFISNLFWTVIGYVQSIISALNIPAFIYDHVITKRLTKYTYYKLFDRMQPRLEKYKKILDVGTGTGEALYSIIDRFSKDTQVVGIDIDANYIKRAQNLFKDVRNVRIRHQDFYELAESKEKFDCIVFSSSFMLMPDTKKALEIAKSLLTPGGKIFFLMTLYAKKKKFTEKIKPYLKYYTTIDFGNITYEWEFEDLLTSNKLNINHKERMFYKFTPLLFLFRVFLVECEIKA